MLVIFRFFHVEYINIYRLLHSIGKLTLNHYIKIFVLHYCVDLISILPSFVAISSGLKLFRIFRMVRAFRVFKMFRYSKSVRIIMSVLQRSKGSLIAVCTMALAYIIVSALVVFNVEPDSFDTFFDAVYWATVSLTTVGYGDIYPITTTGRIVTMFSSLFGVAVVALPAGIITAGYMSEINNDSNKGE